MKQCLPEFQPDLTFLVWAEGLGWYSWIGRGFPEFGTWVEWTCSTKGQLMFGRDDPSWSSSADEDDGSVINCVSWLRKQIQVVLFICPGARGERTIRQNPIRMRRQETEGVSLTLYVTYQLQGLFLKKQSVLAPKLSLPTDFSHTHAYTRTHTHSCLVKRRSSLVKQNDNGKLENVNPPKISYLLNSKSTVFMFQTRQIK